MSDPAPTPSPRRADRRRAQRRAKRRTAIIALALLVVVGGVAAVVLSSHAASTSGSQPKAVAPPAKATTTTGPTTTTTQAPGPGFVAGKVTAIGDSVMIDYEQALQAALPNTTVDGAVSRQWYQGIDLVNQLKAEDQLGATVIIGLSTNGPITADDFAAMENALQGASKVVFINTYVDRDWQDPNNLVIAAGVASMQNAVLVDWHSLAAQHPEWFGPDGTHLAINGPGAQALAQLVAAKAS